VRPSSSPRISTLSARRHRRTGQTPASSCPRLPPAPADLRAPPAARLTCASRRPGPRQPARRVQAIFRRFPLFFTPLLFLFTERGEVRFFIHSPSPVPPHHSRQYKFSHHLLSFSFPFHSTSIRLLSVRSYPRCACPDFPLRRLLLPATAAEREKGEEAFPSAAAAAAAPAPQHPADRDLCSAESIHGGTCKPLRCLSAVSFSYFPSPTPAVLACGEISVCCPDRGELAL